MDLVRGVSGLGCVGVCVSCQCTGSANGDNKVILESFPVEMGEGEGEGE